MSRGGSPWGLSWLSSHISRIRSTSTCSSPPSTSCSALSDSRSDNWTRSTSKIRVSNSSECPSWRTFPTRACWMRTPASCAIAVRRHARLTRPGRSFRRLPLRSTSATSSIKKEVGSPPGGRVHKNLLPYPYPGEAIWACTACGACVEVCPVGNEPMRDILEIRRYLVLTENAFPEQFQASFRGMERAANPWNIGADQRLAWASGLSVPTTAEKPNPELLWWVGCAPATDAQAQKTARAFVRVLEAAEVDYAVLGGEERCSGDPARRAGNEYLFSEMATANVETLNAVAPKRIVTTCPHCLHVLKNEYPAFGGNFSVIHHTALIQELIEAGRLNLHSGPVQENITFHDPCYLGRHNRITEAPRRTLRAAGVNVKEMPRNREMSFCCGAGGGQMWKEEEEGAERVSSDRLREARATGTGTLAVGCPFCMIMLGDAARQEGGEIEVRDIVEIVADRIGGQTTDD